ncbi:hypothetical protein [Nitrosomonas sp. Nm34]|uniref:hypothetical protein n=1 Tax=Nitrosomonas sp. Nm34 TaxID=1881055 RepID=UPI001587A235|nr:hypothetical protein [Nitrosomonas sp. Nm34]
MQPRFYKDSSGTLTCPDGRLAQIRHPWHAPCGGDVAILLHFLHGSIGYVPTTR